MVIDAPVATPVTTSKESPKEARFSKGFVNAFFSLYLVISLGLIGLSPPFQSADAFAHFDRASGIASGQLVAITRHATSGSYLPSGVIDLEDVFSTIPFDPNARANDHQFHAATQLNWNSPKVFVAYTTGGNIPFLYAPQVVGILIGRLVSPHVVVSFYLAELANLLAFIALTRWALLRFPRRLALPLGVFLLLPMTISVAISVNPDCLLLALSMVFAAACYSGYYESRELRTASTTPSPPVRRAARTHRRMTNAYCIGFVSLFFMTLEKPPLILLGLLLPMVDLYTSLKSYIRKVIVFVASAGIPYALWSHFWARGVGGTPPLYPLAPSRQLRLVLSDPLKDLEVIYQTLWRDSWLFWRQLVAGIGWLDVAFPTWVYVALTIVVAASFVTVIDTKHEDLRRFLWSLLVLFATACGISFSLYVAYSPYGARGIYGLQGRYYLPLLPMLIVVLGLHPTRSARLRLAANAVGEYATVALVSLQLLVAAEYVAILLQRYWYKS